MSERVAIVTGAGGELGRATAQKLAAAGFTVTGIDRSERGLKELPDGIGREVADSVDAAAARAVVDRIAAAAGPPEVLVNTIGMFHPGDALTATPEDLRLMIDRLVLILKIVSGAPIRSSLVWCCCSRYVHGP